MKATSLAYKVLSAIAAAGDAGTTNAAIASADPERKNPTQISGESSKLFANKLIARKRDPSGRGYIFTATEAGRAVLAGGAKSEPRRKSRKAPKAAARAVKTSTAAPSKRAARFFLGSDGSLRIEASACTGELSVDEALELSGFVIQHFSTEDAE